MINNLEKIKELLKFEDEHDFYFLQILQRKKDHPEGTVVGSNNSSRLIKGYYIYSIEQLDKYFKEITMLCSLFEARACINLNKRNATDVSLRMLARLADNIRNGHPESSSSLFNTVCGETHSEKDKKWIIDIDDMYNDDQYFDLVSFLHDLEPIGNKVVTNLSSKNGFHIITTPFNIQRFKDSYPTIDVHKNNPTNLYIP